MLLDEGHAVGPYIVETLLGRGGMGSVYRARDPRLERRVALKFLDPDGAVGADHRRLLREARAASALNHPNICQVYDVGVDGERAWIAMEYVEGRTLADILPPEGLPSDTVVRFGRALAGALAHAHARGIVHRDLKPSNIVCTREGTPKILDFGIASRLPQAVADEMTRTITGDVSAGLEGTLAYMAPEVLRGGAATERSDLWSLGVVLYELLAGRRPFEGAEPIGTAAAIVDGTVPPLPASTPATLSRVVHRLLSKNPTDRYRRAEEVEAALDASRPHDAPARPAGTRLLIPILLLLVLAAAGFLWWKGSRFEPLAVVEHRLLSTAVASHRAPAFSPDGGRIAFVAPDENGVMQVRVMDTASGTALSITSGEASAMRPRWSPSGSEIVYALAGQGIWSVSPHGGAPRQVLASGTDPNFSFDGSRLVFEDEREIWTSAADGSDLRRLDGVPRLYYTVPRGPAFSPDGSEIAYFQPEAGPNGDLWVVPAAGGTPRKLTSDLREGGWPVWTPDGRAIVYSSARAGSRTLWQIPVAGGEPMPLTTGAGEDDQPDISRDGQQVTYTNVRNTWDLRVRDLAAGTEQVLLQRGLEVLFPTFSPDGRRIAFFGRSDYAVAIFTIAPDGSDLRQLTAGRELNHQPRWSGDGQNIYFFQSTPELSFRRVPALGGPSVSVRQWEWQTMNAPHFDPSGRYVALVRQQPGAGGAPPLHTTIIHDLETGQNDEWPQPHVHPTGWSADGLSIVGWREGGTIVVCEVAAKTCRAVAQGAFPVWPAGADRIFFARPQNPAEPQSLWSVGLDGTGERFEADMGSFRALDRAFSVSRHGLAVWANFQAGRHEVWTGSLK